jgi:hypothetical protein
MDFTIANSSGFEKVQKVKLRAKLASHEEISPTRIKFCAAFYFSIEVFKKKGIWSL